MGRLMGVGCYGLVVMMGWVIGMKRIASSYGPGPATETHIYTTQDGLFFIGTDGGPTRQIDKQDALSLAKIYGLSARKIEKYFNVALLP